MASPQSEDKSATNESKAEATMLSPSVMSKEYITLRLEMLRMQEAKDQRELELKREEAERQRQHEIEIKREELDLKREAERHELEMKKLELDHELQMANLNAAQEKEKNKQRKDETHQRQFQWRCEAFPPFDEDKDSIDSYLEGFERRARLADGDQKYWVTWLGQVFCKGKVGEVYGRCIKDPDVTYKDVKEALLSHFNLTPEEYRRRFRNLRPAASELPQQFSKRLSRYLDQWLEAENVDDFKQMKELCLVEQIMKCYGPDERVHARQSNAATWGDVVAALQSYVSARAFVQKGRIRVPGGPHQQVSPKEHDDQRHDKGNREESSQPQGQKRFGAITCYNCQRKGHIAKNCDSKPAACASSHDSAHNLIHTSTWSAARDFTMPVTQGTVEGRSCLVLRDTGSGCVIVQKDLVPGDVTNSKRQKITLADGQVKEFPTARVCVESPYLCGLVEVVVMDTPLYPCIIGNVDGAAGPEISQRRGPEPSGSTLSNMDAGRETPPIQGNECCRDDTPSSAVPIAQMEAVGVEDQQETAAPPVSGPEHVNGMEGSAQRLTMEPIPQVQQPTSAFTQDGAGSSSAEVETVDIQRLGGFQELLGETDGSSAPVRAPAQPAAAVTRSQAAAQRQPRNTRPLKTIEAVGSGMNRQGIIKAQASDPTLAKSRELAGKGTVLDHRFGQSKFFVTNGMLMRSYEEYDAPGHVYSQIVLPEAMRPEVLRLAHEGLLSGHLSTEKTFNRIIPHFFWPAMRADVKRHCQSCDSCQRTIAKGKVAPVPLGDVPLVGEPFYRVGVDLVGPLERSSSGKKYILTLVDYATRYPEAVALSNITAETVAEALISIFSRCGCPKVMHSDRGSQFTSGMMAEVCRLLNVKQSFTTAYHPQANGLCEKMNGTLKDMLRRMCAERPKDWDRHLDPLLFAYREVPNASTQFAPFELLYGRSVRGPMAILRESMEEEDIPEEIKTSYEYVFDLRNRLEDTCKAAQENLKVSKALYKKYFDAKTKDRQFAVGDKVLLLLPTEHSKLTMQWRGPYDITARVGQCDYRIVMNGKEKVFHANMMKRYWTRPDVARTSADHGQPDATPAGACVGTLRAAAAAVIHEDSDDVIPTIDVSEQPATPDINPDLTPGQKEELGKFIAEFADRLSALPGFTDLEVHEVELTSDKPVRSRCYNTPYAMREVIDEEIQKMLELNVIEPSKSPYASPVVLVVKKDGTYRFCIDYRRLNSITKFHAEPLPDQTHLFTKLQRAKYLSKLDLTKGYWQVPVPELDRPKTAFVTHNGLWQWKVMPFGMVNSGATFSKMMKKLLTGLNNVHHFIDDVIVGTEVWQSHLRVLRQVFTRLRQHNLTAKPAKCQFGYQHLEFLGHVVGEGLIRTEPGKITKVINASLPTNKKELRSFLGLVGYYQRFVPHFATIAAPLTDALSKGTPAELQWTTAMEAAYTQLKHCVSSAPVLHLADVSSTFILRTDASDRGVGAVLLQNHNGTVFPVEYISRKLKPAEKRYAVIERECLALVWAVQKLQTYLYGKAFTVQTDHSPLVFLHQAKLENSRLMRWALLLQQYRFRIEAIKGSANVGADFMSRCLPSDQH